MTSAKVWPGKPGRSTLRRQVTMKALIAELTLREMNHWAVADFLQCSCSAARNYMKELLEAGVVKLPPRGREKYVIDRAPYSISADAGAIERFLVSQAGREKASGTCGQGFNGLLNGQRVHIASGDMSFPMRFDSPRVHRDPLVSALFGSARPEAAKAGADQG